MSRKLTSFAAAALLAAPAFAGSAAFAQSEPESTEIIVTAQKRDQRLSEVPINITAFTGDFLNDLGVEKFDELAEYVPGLQIQEQSSNNPAFVIRGITSDSGEATTEPRVAIFQDGVSLSRSRGSYVELFDLERVEVAKGPQATLFGRSALIGGINLIQNKASYEHPFVTVEALGGDEGQASLTGVLNHALVDDTLALRVAGRYRTRDGFVDNTLDGERLGDVETQAYRVALRFDPTSDLRFDLISNYQYDDASGTPFVSGSIADTTGDVEPFEDASLNTFGGFENGRELGLDRSVYGTTLKAEWSMSEAAKLTSITAYRRFESLEVFDPDGSPLPLFVFAEDATGDQFSQEIRLNWDGGDRLSGFVGVSYFREEGAQRVPLSFDERLSLALLTGQLQAAFPSPPAAVFQDLATATALVLGLSDPDGPTGPAPALISAATAQGIAANLRPNYTESFTNFGETDSYDLYGDVTFKATDKLELSFGARYTYDDKTSSFLAQIEGAGVQRSILGSYFGALQQLGAGLLSVPEFQAFAGALAVPNAAFIPPSALYPVPNIGLQFQPTGGVASSSDSFDSVTWRAVARYAFTEDLSAWASLATGRRPEVITADADPTRTPGTAPDFNTLPAEKVTSLEVGGAASLLDGALSLNGSVFYYDYTDFQTTEFQGGRLVTVTAGDARSYGFEGQVSYRPTANVEVFGNYGYNNARFASGARDGNSFRLSPDHEAAIGAFLTWPVGVGEVFVTPSYTWRSEIFFDDDNDRADLQTGRLSPALSDFVVDEVQDAYGLLNLRVGFAEAAGLWSVEAFATNALDEDYLIDAGNTGDSFGIPTFIRGPGRLLGVELKAKY